MWLDLFSQLDYCLQKVLLREKYFYCEKKMDDGKRFQLLSDDDRENLSDKAKNINTNRSTNTWINVYKSWARERQENEVHEEYNAG